MKLHGGAAAVEHGAAQVVVHEVAGGASQRLEGVDVPPQEALQRLVEGEQRGKGPRVAEDHDESGDRACALSDADLAERAPVNLCGLAGQGDHPAVDGAVGLGPQAPHEAADLDDRARIAALADHLVDPRGAQIRILRQGVTDERQIRVEDAGPTQAGADPCRRALHRSADRLMVEAELRRDGPDLPVLAVEQAPDLGALRGCDHRSSSSPRCRARASQPATGSPARRPRIEWERAAEPGRRQGRGVWAIATVRWKTDPSRVAGRGRRVAGRGRRVAGRDGRDGPRNSADVGPWQPAPTGDDRPPGSAPCSRRGRDHTRRKWRTGGCSVGRSSGVAAGPRRRSARSKLRLDSDREPWHNSTDRLGLSELGTVTRVRSLHRALTPRLSPFQRYPNAPSLASTDAARSPVRSGTGADDDPSSRRRPSHNPSRSHVQPLPLPVPRSATALRKRPQTDARSAWSSAFSESGLNRPAFKFLQVFVSADTGLGRHGDAGPGAREDRCRPRPGQASAPPAQ